MLTMTKKEWLVFCKPLPPKMHLEKSMMFSLTTSHQGLEENGRSNVHITQSSRSSTFCLRDEACVGIGSFLHLDAHATLIFEAHLTSRFGGETTDIICGTL